VLLFFKACLREAYLLFQTQSMPSTLIFQLF
jgi:hypothetical protein